MKIFVDLEDNKIFKAIITIIFYLSSIVGVSFIFTGQFYITLSILLLWILFIMFPYHYLFEKRDMEHAFNDFINLIDDPIDNIKHKIHGMKIFGKTIYLPKWLMRNTDNPDK